ncbi:MAG: hypothetical protein HKN37_13655 [Rhodothermales bacterium]|nr:hypothetical protein [Rhodothermales bacterium]
MRIENDRKWMNPKIAVLLILALPGCDILGIGGGESSTCGERVEGNWEVEEGYLSPDLELDWEGFESASVSSEVRGDRRIVSGFVNVDGVCPTHHPDFDFYVKVDKDVEESVEVRLVVDWAFLYQKIIEASTTKDVGLHVQLEGSGDVGLKQAFDPQEAWFFATLEISFPTLGSDESDGDFVARHFEAFGMRAFWRKYKPPS